MDKDLTEVAVPALADPIQLRLASGGVLVRSIRDVCRFAVKVSNCFWVNFFFNSTLPLSPRATR
jgi:hypothetical protein